MIQLVDKALEQFLREAVPLPERAADISFQPPDRTWGAGLNRPTVNVFLWDVCRAANHLKASMEQRVGPSGRIERRLANPVVELHYLLTAWATELRDEHQLLGTVMECILANSTLDSRFLPDHLSGARCGLALAPEHKRVPGDFWSALDGTLKPGLQLEVTLPVEVFAWRDTATPAEEVAVSVTRTEAPASPSPTAAPQPALTRTRRAGALVMEGRAPKPAKSDRPRS